MAHLVDDQPVAVVQLDPALEQMKPTKNGREEIVEVVRDAAGELADGVHLLRLEQLVLELAPFADVEQRPGKFDRRAVAGADQHRLVVKMDVMALGAAPAIMQRPTAGLRSLGQLGQHPRAVFGVEPVLPEIVALDIGQIVAGDPAQIAADERRPARRPLDRLEVEDDRQRFDDRGLALFGEAQLALDGQLLGLALRLASSRACSRRRFSSTSLRIR